jgi:hypothetical protein
MASDQSFLDVAAFFGGVFAKNRLSFFRAPLQSIFTFRGNVKML